MTYRSLSLYSPDFNPNDKGRVEPSAPPPIQFRHIALLLLGGSAAGCFIGFLVGVPTYGFTHSKFVLGAILGMSFYSTLMVGYHWISQEQDWVGLRRRFLPVGRKPLVFSALSALALIAFISLASWILRWAGVQFADFPSPIELESWTQLPPALFLIVILAPVCEELIFRGLLLDWLRQKMNVWLAALLLSVIFSLLHINHFSLGAVGWLAFADRFLLGMGASALTTKHRSLRPAFVMHATFNATAVFAIAINKI